jgi:hypothetical protein
MVNYRLIEYFPIDGKYYGKRAHTTVWVGPDKAGFKQAIDDWYTQPRKPYAELFYYHGSRRIYAYEI